jgi:hypothetical protein
MKNTIKLAVIAIVVGFGGLCFVFTRPLAQTTSTTPAQVLTAGQRYKNIKVLNDMPADQLGRVMNLWSASLGVDCNFCHNTKDFSSDEKREKGTAREMVKMTFAIDKENFNGRPRISCNTCHNGHQEPRSTPDLNAVPPTEGETKQPDPKPSADKIFDTYVAAVGGKDKLDKVTSRTITATRTERDGKEVEKETLYYENGKYAMQTVYPQATVTEAFNGTDSVKFAKQPIKLRIDEQEQIRREANMFSPMLLKAAYTKLDFGRADMLNGTPVNVLIGTTAANGRELLFFDAATGLLVERQSSSQTIFGRFALQIDYMDYKSFGGVKLPTTIKYSMPNISWTRRILTVKNNEPVDQNIYKAPVAAN